MISERELATTLITGVGNKPDDHEIGTVIERLLFRIDEYDKDFDQDQKQIEELQDNLRTLTTCESCPRPAVVYACHLHAMDG